MFRPNSLTIVELETCLKYIGIQAQSAQNRHQPMSQERDIIYKVM